MRAALRTAGRIAAPRARVTLRMTIGVHSDALHLFLVGGSHLEPVVCGPAASTVLRMEQAARPGDIVVSPQTAALLPARSLARRSARAGCCARRPAVPTRRPTRAPSRSPGDARRALPSDRACARTCATASRRRSTGSSPSPSCASAARTRSIQRDTAPTAAADALDELVRDVQAAADEHEVAFLGSDADVDGGKLLLCAGAPRVAGDDEERMLAALRRVVEGGAASPCRSA